RRPAGPEFPPGSAARRLCLTVGIGYSPARAGPAAHRLSAVRRAPRAKARGALSVLRDADRAARPGGTEPRGAHREGRRRDRHGPGVDRGRLHCRPRPGGGGAGVRGGGGGHVLPRSQDVLMAAAGVPRLRAVRTAAQAGRVDLTLLPVREGDLAGGTRPLGRAAAAGIERRAREAEFRGRVDDFLLLQTEGGAVALAGLGSGQNDLWLRIGGRLRREAERLGARRVAAPLGAHAEHRDTLTNIALGFLFAGYSFDRSRSERRPRRTESLTLVSESLPQPATLRHLLEDAHTLADGVFGVRDLVNEPPSVATPQFLAECAHRLAAGAASLEVEVWEP